MPVRLVPTPLSVPFVRIRVLRSERVAARNRGERLSRRWEMRCDSMTVGQHDRRTSLGPVQGLCQKNDRAENTALT